MTKFYEAEWKEGNSPTSSFFHPVHNRQWVQWTRMCRDINGQRPIRELCREYCTKSSRKRSATRRTFSRSSMQTGWTGECFSWSNNASVSFCSSHIGCCIVYGTRRWFSLPSRLLQRSRRSRPAKSTKDLKRNVTAKDTYGTNSATNTPTFFSSSISSPSFHLLRENLVRLWCTSDQQSDLDIRIYGINWLPWYCQCQPVWRLLHIHLLLAKVARRHFHKPEWVQYPHRTFDIPPWHIGSQWQVDGVLFSSVHVRLLLMVAGKYQFSLLWPRNNRWSLHTWYGGLSDSLHNSSSSSNGNSCHELCCITLVSYHQIRRLQLLSPQICI